MFFYTKGYNSLINNFGNWIKQHKIHLFVWAIFIFYESAIVSLYTGELRKFSNYAIHYVINISFFYIQAHLVLNNALKNKKKAYLRLPLYIALQLIAYTLVVLGTDSLLFQFTNVFGEDLIIFDRPYYGRTVFRGFYYLAFGTGYYFLITYLKEKRRADKLERVRLTNLIRTEKFEKELVKAQNAYLRAQINPHFLFNTLDFIYHNTRKTAPMAAETISILADIMRYATDTDFTGDYSMLGDEIDQIANLIRLHQIKNNFNLNLDFQFEEELRELKFIPLVLTTLVENMLKHGLLDNEDCPASIKLYVQNKVLFIETTNLINDHQNLRGLHTGINNLKQRLKYAYGDHCSFSSDTDERNYFNVLIWIKL